MNFPENLNKKQQEWEQAQQSKGKEDSRDFKSSYSNISPEEAEKKWSHKIFTMDGRSKAEQQDVGEELLEEMRQENIKGEMNFYQKLRKLDKQTVRAREHVMKDEKLGKDIPIDGDYVEGSAVYMRNCSGCHSLESSSIGRKTTGPALGLIFGKRVGSDQHYQDYTENMIDSRVIWNKRGLFRFLTNPQQLIKGTRCGSSLVSEEDRADLIQFMKVYSKGLAKNLRIRANKVYGKDYVDIQLQSQYLLENEAKRKINNNEV